MTKLKEQIAYENMSEAEQAALDNTDNATAMPLDLMKVAWITQPSDERADAAMIVDSSTECYIVANELGYAEAQHICRVHNDSLKAVNEHAALVAVAAAAKFHDGASSNEQRLRRWASVQDALANLDAVREGGGK